MATAPDKEKDGGLDALIKAINSVVKGAVVTKPMDINTIPSGSLLIDSILGVGGYPFHRITEVFGGESAGKSTVCLTLCANAQSMGVIPTYIDVENSVDYDYAAHLGVNTSEWVLAQPDHAEDAFRIAETAIQNGSKLIVIDSIGALVAKRETEEESDIGDNQIGLIPKLVSKFVRRISPLLNKYECAVVLINQRRAKIGAMVGASTEDTPGGLALKHAYGVRMKITRIGNDTGENPKFIKSKVQIIKNKVAPPLGTAVIRIGFGTGIDLWYEVVQLGVSSKIIKKSGSWYKYNGENIGQGDKGAAVYLKEHPEVLRLILQSDPKLNLKFYMDRLSQVGVIEDGESDSDSE